MGKFSQSKWFYLFISLFFALLLFFNANHSNQEVTFQESKGTDVYTETISNVPIELEYDKDKYFVNAEVSDVSVRLSSKNRVALDAETNRQTRHFSVVADLQNYTPGTYVVPLTVKNLNSALKASLGTKKITVTIANKEQRNFSLQTNVNEKWLEKGMEIQNISIQPKTVKISTSTQDMNKIQKVMVMLPEQSGIKNDFQEQGVIKAYDFNGQEVKVDCSPKHAIVSVKVDRPHKKVPLNLLQSGTPAKGIENYQFLCDTQEITLQGKMNVLKSIHNVNVYVNIDNVDKTLTRKVSLSLPEGVESDTHSVAVTIIPQLKRNT